MASGAMLPATGCAGMSRSRAAKSMSAKQYKESLPEVGLNQTSAAHFFGVHGVTGRRWAISGPPAVVAKFLRVMIINRWTADDVDRVLDKTPQPVTSPT